MCCDHKRKECMFKECSRCQLNKISDDLESELLESETFYDQWVSVKESRIGKNNNPIEVRVTKKVKTVCTVKELISQANSQLCNFMRHMYTADHQKDHISDVKKTLHSNEVVILMDFSENYVCKLNNEVQSAHFGASKKQISLHTGVVYTRNPDAGKGQSMAGASVKPICTSFCTVSESYRHDASAIWAHLQPVLKLIKEQLPHIDTFHFQSDGPTTQYRNKGNFFFMMYFANSFSMKEVTRNFSESGHGKSSVDGIGGSVKRKLMKESHMELTLSTSSLFFKQSDMRAIKLTSLKFWLQILKWLIQFFQQISKQCQIQCRFTSWPGHMRSHILLDCAIWTVVPAAHLLVATMPWSQAHGSFANQLVHQKILSFCHIFFAICWLLHNCKVL